MSKIDHNRPSLRHKGKKIIINNDQADNDNKYKKLRIFKYGKPKLLRKGKLIK